jgi:hypothetical protein
MNSNLALENIRYPYLETFNIISSVKRILMMNEKQSIYIKKMSKFNEEILYKEYEEIHKVLNLSILEISNRMNYTDSLLNRYDGGENIDFNSEDIVDKIFPAINIYDFSDYILSDILPINNKTPVYIETGFEGLKSSRKYFKGKNSSIFCPYVMQQYLGRCHLDYTTMNDFNLNDYMDHKFNCNRSITKLLIMLFHYYSEVMIKSTKIKIVLRKDDEYQIKWSISKKNYFKK